MALQDLTINGLEACLLWSWMVVDNQAADASQQCQEYLSVKNGSARDIFTKMFTQKRQIH